MVVYDDEGTALQRMQSYLRRNGVVVLATAVLILVMVVAVYTLF